jgi:hypothetical protein
MRSFARSAQFDVELPLAEARSLFTPEGERRWVSEWAPEYPDPERKEGVGATFLTSHGDAQTVWVMTDAEPDRVRYARITGGVDAGLVDVHCRETEPGSTTVTVSYQLTALTDEGQVHLDDFAAHYDEFIASWQRRISRLLADGE